MAKRKKISGSDLRKDGEMNPDVEHRDIQWARYSDEHGRSTVRGDCPFCDTEIEAYIWSLSGGGKRCPGCDAMTSSFGIAYQFKSVVEDRKQDQKRIESTHAHNKKARKKVRK